MREETLIEWTSPEHHFEKKSKDWYWALGIIALAIAVLSFYFGNFLFGILVIVGGITLSILSYKETRTIEVRVTQAGIVLDKYLYPWSSYQYFWIEDDHIHGSRILLNPKNTFLPLVIVHINEEVNLDDLRETMLQFLEEGYLRESIIHEWFDKLISR